MYELIPLAKMFVRTYLQVNVNSHNMVGFPRTRQYLEMKAR